MAQKGPAIAWLESSMAATGPSQPHDLLDVTAWPCFAVAAPGLEPLVAAEIAELGCAAREVEGGAEFAAPAEILGALIRRLRIASRVLVRMAEGRVDDPAAVASLLARLPWPMLPAWPGKVALRLSAQAAPPDRIRWVQAELLRALLARFGPDRVLAGAGSGDADDVAIVARLHGRRCTLSVDAGGRPLHQRGYRLEAGPAPLRETLAAAMLRAVGYRGEGTLWDPMCGSGTIPIEAALWLGAETSGARELAVDRWRIPRLQPMFSAMPEPGGDGTAALAAGIGRRAPRIIGGDLDAEVLTLAARNAERAGVSQRIAWQHAEMAAQAFEPVAPVFVVTNPPYGQRLGGRNAARRLYERLGAVLGRNGAGGRAAVLVAERDLARLLPLVQTELRQVENGGLRVWIVTGEIAPRLIGVGRNRRASTAWDH